MPPHNAWIAHVQQVRAAGNLTYKEALTTASATYRSQSAAAASRVRYGSGIVDDLSWNKADSLGKILKAIDNDDFPAFKAALTLFDGKLWAGKPNPLKGVSNLVLDTVIPTASAIAAPWTLPITASALIYRLFNAAPQTLALMVYLHIHDVIKKDKKKDHYVTFLKEKFDAAYDSVSQSGDASGGLQGLVSRGLQLKKIRLHLDSQQLGPIKRAWKMGINSLPSDLKNQFAFTQATTLMAKARPAPKKA
jgi:hypothetical protein